MQHLDEGILQAWLDRPRSGLDPSEVAEIEAHLGSCEACAAALGELKGSDTRLHALLESGLDREVPRPPFEEVVRRAELRHGAGSGRGLRLNRLAWAASIVVALGVGYMGNEMIRTRGLPTPEPARTFEAEMREADGASSPAVEEAREEVGAAPAPARQVTPTPVEEVERMDAIAPPPATEPAAAPFIDGGGAAAASATVEATRTNAAGLAGPPTDGEVRARTSADDLGPDLADDVAGAASDDVSADAASPGRRALAEPLVTAEASGWRPVTPLEAERELGRAPVIVPELEVVSVEAVAQAAAGGGPAVRVRQDLGGGAVVTLLEGVAEEDQDAWPIDPEGGVASRRFGALLVTATAPLSAQELTALLGRAR